MNNLYYDYIGAKGSYEINDYIDTEIKITSNILNTKINTTSNFLRGYTDTNITILDNKYNNLIREVPDNNLTNLYINNSNIGGEIRFFVKQSGIFDINNATAQPYRVKIGADGKLYLYYNYNAAIGLLETERWVEPINELIAHKVGIANLGAITGATDVTIAKIIIDVNQLNSIVLTDNIITNADRLILRDTSTLYGQAKIVFEKIKNQFTYANAIYAGIVGSVGFGIVSMSYGYIQSKVNADYIENNLKYQLSSNTVMTPAEKEQLKTDTFNVYTSNINDMNFYSCNLNILNGFINCNITTPQTIANINTSNITLNTVGNTANITIPSNGLSIGGYSSNIWMSFSSNYSNQIYFNGNKTIDISSNLVNFSGNVNFNNLSIPSIAQTTILTETPNAMKKKGFLIYVNNPVYPNGGNTLYYSYDIYLPSYVSQAIVENSSDPYRNFRIHISYASSYYEYLKNGLPNCLSYEIFMSDKANAGSSGIGKQYLNICALGTPENYYLDKIMPNDLFLMRSPFAYFDRLCVISSSIADVRVIIEDLLN